MPGALYRGSTGNERGGRSVRSNSSSTGDWSSCAGVSVVYPSRVTGCGPMPPAVIGAGICRKCPMGWGRFEGGSRVE